MAETVYTLCALTSFLCAVLLVHNWRKSRARILLWSSLCFVGLAVNNLLLLVDLVYVADVSLARPRALSALASLGLLIFGLIWERR